MKIDKTQAENDFEVFLTIMDDQIEGLKENAEKRSIFLDDSINDCEKLEKLFDSMAADLSENEKKGLIGACKKFCVTAF